MPGREDHRNRWFVDTVLPHGAAAYNLARWITRNDADAGDVVQEAFARALQYAGSYHGGDARSWLLSIVRNTAFTWTRANPGASGEAVEDVAEGSAPDPLHEAASAQEAAVLRRAIARLPLEQREVLVLREFEDLAYREIAVIVGCPIGTVMSRLSRARDGISAMMRCEDKRP